MLGTGNLVTSMINYTWNLGQNHIVQSIPQITHYAGNWYLGNPNDTLRGTYNFLIQNHIAQSIPHYAGKLGNLNDKIKC